MRVVLVSLSLLVVRGGGYLVTCSTAGMATNVRGFVLTQLRELFSGCCNMRTTILKPFMVQELVSVSKG